MKIRFIEDREVLDGEGNVIQCFTAGKEYDLNVASARRWLRRSAAEEVDETAVETVKEPEPVAEKEPEPGEAESQPNPIGSEAGEDRQSSLPQADQASQKKTSKPYGSGRRRGRPRKNA